LTAAGLPELAALNGGISRAFQVAAVLGLGAVVCAIFMRNPKPEPSGSADELEVEHGMA
jgi:hypothetical protein